MNVTSSAVPPPPPHPLRQMITTFGERPLLPLPSAPCWQPAPVLKRCQQHRNFNLRWPLILRIIKKMIHFPKHMLSQNTKHFTVSAVSHKKQLNGKYFSFKQQYHKTSPTICSTRYISLYFAEILSSFFDRKYLIMNVREI